jgi:formylglycine-generating enzyme required for sulfatase activity
MKQLKIILLALAFVTLQAHAKDDGRNLTVTKTASGGKRVALVIGNGNYQHSDSLPKLANPTHDAEDIAKALRGFGFEVIEKKDQSLEGMSEAITEFSRKIGDSEAALFYFAGHGLQVKGQNYIIPIDAKIETEAQVSFKSINVNLILDEMDNGKSRANIVMLDACRNNPISGKFRSGATRGLAAPSSQPKGTVIVYATDPGNVAADGSGRNGLFTAGLLTAFKGSDLSLGGVLVRASEEVERGSAQKQTPYINGPATLQKNFQFAPGQSTQLASMVSVSAPVEGGIRDDTKRQRADAALSLANNTTQQAVQIFRDCQDCPEMIVIPTGSFEMGSNSGEAIEKPVHRVTINRSFALGKTEVTQGQWKAIMGNNPSKFSSCGDTCPVEQVSWNDAQEFIQKLNLKTGKQYRLPSEAEWEYACRAGGENIYCGSDNLDSVGWYGASANQPGNAGRTNPVGLKQANAFGLYDMSGNVWEWVEDSYHDNYNGAPTDGSAWSGDGAKRALRGGSWGFGFQEARAALRGYNVPTNRSSTDLGFRLARILP